MTHVATCITKYKFYRERLLSWQKSTILFLKYFFSLISKDWPGWLAWLQQLVCLLGSLVGLQVIILNRVCVGLDVTGSMQCELNSSSCAFEAGTVEYHSQQIMCHWGKLVLVDASSLKYCQPKLCYHKKNQGLDEAHCHH